MSQETRNTAAASYATLYTPQEMERAKKKKKRALLVFLIIVLLIVGVVLVIWWSNKKANELLHSTITPYSFGYSGYDYHEYVTQDISLPTELYLANGKAVPIQWSAKDEGVLDAQGKVHRPKSENVEATLTAAIRHGLGKGKADFTFNVIKTDHIPRSEVYVLTREEVESGEARHHLFVGFEDESNENIFSVYGNFGQTKVTSMEDALYVMELYRPLFGLDASHQFAPEDVLPGNGTKTYKLRQMLNDLPYWGNSVTMTVKDNGKLEAINLHICRDTQINCDFSMTQEELKAIATAELGEEAVVAVPEKGIHVSAEGVPSPVYRFYAASKDEFENEKTLNTYKMEVNAETREVLSKSDASTGLLDTQAAQEIAEAAENEASSEKTEDGSEEIKTNQINSLEDIWVTILNNSIVEQKTVTAKDVFGNDREFIVSRLGAVEEYGAGAPYIMHDPTRNISITHPEDDILINILKTIFEISLLPTITNLDFLTFFEYVKKGEFEELSAQIAMDQHTVIMLTEVFINAVKSHFAPMRFPEDPDSQNPRAVSAYVNLRDTYDWYLEHLNRNSFDGKGQRISCTVDVYGVDLAMFTSIGEYIIVGPGSTDFTYPPCGALDTMAHEYTHGVFYHVVGELSGCMGESIDEGYADIFACLVEGNWKMGESVANVVIRDPTGTETNFVRNYKYPTTYMGQHWDSKYGHINSILLSRAAYQMTQNGFTEEEVTQIWYKSMHYGYNNSSDFLTVRHNVIEAAALLGYTSQQIAKIENIFGNMGIGSLNIVDLFTDAIPEHPLMDDFTDEKFLMPMTPLMAVLIDKPVYIYQLDNGKPSDFTDEEVSAMMSAVLSYRYAAAINEIPFELTMDEFYQIVEDLAAFNSDGELPSDATDEKILEIVLSLYFYEFDAERFREYDPSIPIQKHIRVEYKRLPQKDFEIYEKFLDKANILESSAAGLDGMEIDIGNAKDYLELADSELMGYVWNPSVHEMPAYTFWTEYVGVDFFTLAKMGYLIDSAP